MFRSKLNLIFLTSIFLFSFFLFVILSQAKSVVDKNHVSARRAADYIHAVIQADRTIYSQYIVERLGETVSLKATENWKKEDSLLLPAQFLMMSSKLVNSKNLGVRFRLLSLWPINKNNGPKTSKEKTGLKKVVDNPDKPFIWTTHRNGTWKYNAIYPDKAVAKSCALCHNNHPRSPKKNFKRGDVMGGIHISFPVSKPSGTKSDLKFRVAPEVVADYVHAILDADRTVYAKHIVDRLQKKNIIYPSE
ncbi:MAG: DUF3365 domain-containing protein, partial [Nitrospinaceae bacterium]|nr:DUF3365 domain-containing protein [Nitrospinaceae bacterium]NIR56083.1 DUF3365 domain-containing protein [Nitrospinaceae bacterium]NIS86531.1 DUF3365 domain-containing protein [Nitrospinaceae bacterium]NIT83365.1 DUF3365 domain-containing protein [Nitrospinaceae bacterium]NIU45575.1 DUF3365 domain-containing protein [Nitrospinaceae bacterium]